MCGGVAVGNQLPAGVATIHLLQKVQFVALFKDESYQKMCFP